MISGFTGSITIDPIASEHCLSVSGVQVEPPSVVFQTPPCAPPMYTMLLFVGWTATVEMRPIAVPLIENGPIDCHRDPPIGGAPRMRRLARNDPSWRRAFSSAPAGIAAK